MRLVADIGGTNARFALCDSRGVRPDTIRRYRNADWPAFNDVLDFYLKQVPATPTEIVAAVAAPVSGDVAALTNYPWIITAQELMDRCPSAQVHFLNDLTALGYAVPCLGPDQLGCIAAGGACRNAPSQSLVVGIGTGINVSPSVQRFGKTICTAVEAGHMALPHGIAQQLPGRAFHTYEDLFSGRGFMAFCRARSWGPPLGGPALMAAYGASGSQHITDAIDDYARLLAQLVRDLALAYLPTSGIYFAGSVARPLLQHARQAFLEVYQAPGPVPLLPDVPIWMITDDAAALHGCAAYQID